MDGAVFPPCCLSWGQTMIEVMKIMEISFKRSHAPNPEAGRWSTPLLETAWHSLASVSQALVESMLLPPGSWCTQGLFMPSKSLFLQSYVSSGGSMVGLMETSSKRAYAIPMSAAPRARAPVAGHCWPVPSFLCRISVYIYICVCVCVCVFLFHPLFNLMLCDSD